MTSAVMRFPENRLASFTCSFGANANGTLRVVGTRGTSGWIPRTSTPSPTA
jgi:hypothetical protein